MCPQRDASAEDRAAYEELTTQYYERFQPHYPEERAMLDDVIFCDWSIRRFQRLRSECQSMRTDWDSILAFKHAAYRSALKFLREYQANPLPQSPLTEDPIKVVVH